MCQRIEHTALVRQNITRRPTRTGRVVVPRIGWDLPTNGVERFDSCDEIVELLIQGASTFFSGGNCNGRVGKACVGLRALISVGAYEAEVDRGDTPAVRLVDIREAQRYFSLVDPIER